MCILLFLFLVQTIMDQFNYHFKIRSMLKEYFFLTYLREEIYSAVSANCKSSKTKRKMGVFPCKKKWLNEHILPSKNISKQDLTKTIP